MISILPFPLDRDSIYVAVNAPVSSSSSIRISILYSQENGVEEASKGGCCWSLKLKGGITSFGSRSRPIGWYWGRDDFGYFVLSSVLPLVTGDLERGPTFYNLPADCSPTSDIPAPLHLQQVFPNFSSCQHSTQSQPPISNLLSVTFPRWHPPPHQSHSKAPAFAPQ